MIDSWDSVRDCISPLEWYLKGSKPIPKRFYRGISNKWLEAEASFMRQLRNFEAAEKAQGNFTKTNGSILGIWLELLANHLDGLWWITLWLCQNSYWKWP